MAQAEGISMAAICREALASSLKARVAAAKAKTRFAAIEAHALRIRTSLSRPAACPHSRTPKRLEFRQYTAPKLPASGYSSRQLDEMWA